MKKIITIFLIWEIILVLVPVVFFPGEWHWQKPNLWIVLPSINCLSIIVFIYFARKHQKLLDVIFVISSMVITFAVVMLVIRIFWG